MQKSELIKWWNKSELFQCKDKNVALIEVFNKSGYKEAAGFSSDSLHCVNSGDRKLIFGKGSRLIIETSE